MKPPIKSEKRVKKVWAVILPNSGDIALYNNNFLAISDWNEKGLLDYAKELGNHLWNPEVVEVTITYTLTKKSK